MLPSLSPARYGFRPQRGAGGSPGEGSNSGNPPNKGGPYKEDYRYSTWPEYRYKVAGKRKGHKVRIDPVLHPDPRAAWQRLFDQPFASFEPVAAKRSKAAPVLPKDMLPPAPRLHADIFGTNRRDPDAPPMPIAPLQFRTGSGHDIRYWPDDGHGQPILMRSVLPPRPKAATLAREAPKPAEPELDVDDLRAEVGISPFSFRREMERACYRRMTEKEREGAALDWLIKKVGPERVNVAARDIWARRLFEMAA